MSMISNRLWYLPQLNSQCLTFYILSYSNPIQPKALLTP